MSSESNTRLTTERPVGALKKKSVGRPRPVAPSSGLRSGAWLIADAFLIGTTLWAAMGAWNVHRHRGGLAALALENQQVVAALDQVLSERTRVGVAKIETDVDDQAAAELTETSTSAARSSMSEEPGLWSGFNPSGFPAGVEANWTKNALWDQFAYPPNVGPSSNYRYGMFVRGSEAWLLVYGDVDGNHRAGEMIRHYRKGRVSEEWILDANPRR